MWHKYTKENCYQSEEYYIKRGASKEEAKELGIKGYTKMNKEELIKELEKED